MAQEAARCGAHYINQRWLGGMLTNWTTIKTRRPAERLRTSGAEHLICCRKKEAAEMAKPRNTLGGIKTMRKVYV